MTFNGIDNHKVHLNITSNGVSIAVSVLWRDGHLSEDLIFSKFSTSNTDDVRTRDTNYNQYHKRVFTNSCYF